MAGIQTLVMLDDQGGNLLQFFEQNVWEIKHIQQKWCFIRKTG